MDVGTYERIMELAKEGKTGLEIVAQINEEMKPEPESERNPEPENNPEPEKKEPFTAHELNPVQTELLARMEVLDKRITELTETTHALNIMNSKQPESPVQSSTEILGALFAGYTEAKDEDKKGV